MNIAILQGRPTKDPELKDTASGKVMCKIRLAVDRPYLGKNAPKRTDYFDVICFGELGRSMYKHLAKGALCTVLGRLEQSEFMDRSGAKRENYSVVANKVTIHEWLRKSSALEALQADEDLMIPREITKSLGMKAVDFSDEDMPTNYYDL
jgi:single-strand DNA-binding protein